MIRPVEPKRISTGLARSAMSSRYLRLSLGKRKGMAIAIPTMATMIVAMLLSYLRWPVPRLHDDFSNLLVSETLRQGRWCNPTPAAYQSMESFHLLMIPNYASKFPIGPGAIMALGEYLFGSPVVGLWISASLATACLTWMLAAHLTPRWILAAGMFLSFHPCWQNGWAQEFTHGWLPMAGTALVLGGVLRIRQRTLRRAASLNAAILAASAIGIGGILVLFSRPFDGGVVCFLLVASLIPIVCKQQWYLRARFWGSAGWSAGIIGLGVLLQLAVNMAVTGRIWQLPYQLHETQYGVAPLFIWGTPHEPSLGHRFVELEQFHRVCSLQSWQQARSVPGFITTLVARSSNLISHWGSLLATLPLTVLLIARERKRFWWLWMVVCVSLLVINCVPWVMPAYVAALVPIALLLACVGIQGAIRWWVLQVQTPNAIVRSKVEYSLIGLLGVAHLCAFSITTYSRATFQSGWEQGWADHRVELEQRLQSTDGNHLVLVRYSPGHDVQEEWVYNSANPTLAKIVWARLGDEIQNESLIRGYSDRMVWLLQADSAVLTCIGNSNDLCHRTIGK